MSRSASEVCHAAHAHGDMLPLCAAILRHLSSFEGETRFAVNITFLLLERAPTPGGLPMGAFLRCYISVFALPNFLEGTKPKPITIV